MTVENGKRSVVIVGASDKPDRTSHQLLQRLLGCANYRPIPVHPRLKAIDGQPVVASLADLTAKPDIVSLYVNAQTSQGLESELVRLRPGKVVFNPGAENPELMEKLRQSGIGVEEACSLVLLSQNAL